MQLTLRALRQYKVFMRNLRWDVTPEVLFKPRFTGHSPAADLSAETNGFMFYVDTFAGPPKLMVMRSQDLMSNLFCEVTDVPGEMLNAALKAEGVKPITCMYPIDAELERWLKAELGLS